MKDLNKDCCFQCVHFVHFNPDDDGCEITNEIVYVDSCPCEKFERYKEKTY